MGQDEVTFSIVIPVYNVEQYIEECLESVVSQRNAELEIIIVDDGSTDHSSQICIQYMTLNSNVKYIKQQNAGLGAARNTGLSQAHGEYIIFLDSDDYWNENSIIKISNVIKNFTCLDIVYFDSDVIYDNNEIKNNKDYDLRMYYRKDKIELRIYQGVDFFNETYPKCFNVSACMAVYRRKFLIEHGIVFSENILYEDNLFSLQTVLRANYVKYLPEKIYVRRYRSASIMTSKIDQESVRSTARIFHLTMNYSENDKEHYEEIVFRKINDFCLQLAYTFWQRCSICKENNTGIQHLKESVYVRVYELLNKKRKENLRLEEWMILILLGQYLKDDASMNHFTRYILQKEKIDSIDTYIFKCKNGYCTMVEDKIWKIFSSYRNKKVGIYGKGNHSKQLLHTLRYLNIMPINLFIIDSNEESGIQKFDGLSVLNVKDVPEDTDMVIISSFLYEHEMYHTALKYLSKRIKVEKIYKNEIREICWEWLNDVRGEKD